MEAIEPLELSAIEEARARIHGPALRTPLVALGDHIEGTQVYLKLENLQPIGSFKIRGAANAMALIDETRLRHGVYTASAGNMAQGVAFAARDRGIPCRVITPDHAPRTKLEAIARLDAEVRKIPFEKWWQVMIDHGDPREEGAFIHPVSNRDVMAGNGTIGLEIVEDLPEVDAVIVPYGGGGLISGISAAIRGHKPDTRIYAAEVETAAPLQAALEAGYPQPVDYQASFVDGIGGSGLLPEMWPLAKASVDASIVVSLEAIAASIRLLVEHNRVVAEGAGAAAVAAALTGAAGRGNVVCVISGGNIDREALATILSGGLPERRAT